jgi:hypothetical protein
MLLCRAGRPGHCASAPATYPHPFWNYHRNPAYFTYTNGGYPYCHLFTRRTNSDAQAAYRYPGTHSNPIFSNAGHSYPDPCTQYGYPDRYAYSGNTNQYSNRDLAPKPYPNLYRDPYFYPYLNRHWNRHGYGYRDSHAHRNPD